MQDQTTQYRTNYVTFDLPSRLKDKTVHIFSLTDDGPSDFSVVISHADAGTHETLKEFSDRLLDELEKSLPRFLHTGTRERTLDGAPAIELAYEWLSEGKFLHQRQVITLVPGAVSGTRTAMMIGATCLRAFNDEWKTEFESILGSMKLRGHAGHPTIPSAAADAAAMPVVFALSERRRSLQAFADHDEACRTIDAREVEQGAWAFFDGAGNPLAPKFVVPNSGTVWPKPGKYVLEPGAGPARANLRNRLSVIAIFVPAAPGLPFDSIDAVQTHLDNLEGAK